MQKIILGLLFIASTCLPAQAQIDDDAPKPPVKYRWKYFFVKEIVQQNDRQVVHIQVDRFEEYQLYSTVKQKAGYQAPKYGEVKTYPIETTNNDSIWIYRPMKAGMQKAIELKLPILSVSFVDDNKNYKPELIFQFPAGKDMVAKGDLVPVKVENKYDTDSLLFFRLADNQMTLLRVTGEKLFPNNTYSSTAAGEMECVKWIIDELHTAGELFKDKLKDPFILTGPNAGKTAPQLLSAATEKQVINFANFLATFSRGFMGTEFKVAEEYGNWLKNDEPKGKYKNLKVEEEYDKWIKIEPIVINLDAGTIDDKPIQQVLNNWMKIYPFYDGDEKTDPAFNYEADEEEDNKKAKPVNPYVDYNLLGNGLTYYPKQKALKILLVNHQYIQYSKLKEGTVKELKQQLGAPAKVLNNESYFFATPFGTMEFYVNNFYGTISLIYLYPVKPSAVVQAEPNN